MIRFLGKAQKMKHYLEENGLRFPTEVNQGSMTNKQSKFYPLISSHSSLFSYRQRFPGKDGSPSGTAGPASQQSG